MADGMCFEVRVAQIYRAGNKTKGEAIKEAMRRYPEEHAEFIERVNNGGVSLLEKALEK